MDAELKDWLTERFDSQERQSKERMDRHIEADRAVHERVLGVLQEHKLAIYGDGTKDRPGLDKEMDRLQNGIVTLRWVGGVIASATSWNTIKQLFK